jgi:glycosyltransferase involved in cell wall biosynthesis
MAANQQHDDAGLKLAIVLPALNEEATVGRVIAAVPRRVPDIREVEVILVDDGSSDKTSLRALAAGVDRIVSHAGNRGLVAAFRTGTDAALRAGADIVVHLDSDGQHDPTYIPRLVAPIVARQADIVVGVRPLTQATEMTRVRRLGNRLGSWVLRRLLNLPVSDFTSGYRALSRESLLRLNLVSDYTYTLESLIQAARMRLAVAEVAVPDLRRSTGVSRIAGSVPRYVVRAGTQALRCVLHTKPLAAFGRAAALMMLLALGFTAWFLWGYQSGGMHLPALLAALLAFVMSVGLFITGLVADGVSSNRRLLEDVLCRIKSLEAQSTAETTGNGDLLSPARLSEIA